MWHFISDQISNKVNQTFICETAKLTHQQHQHACYVLKGANKRYFVKLRESNAQLINQQPHPSPLKCEADGLAAIESADSINTPRVICYGTLEENQKSIEYLVMQYICFKPPTESLWDMAGEQLALMHLHPTQEIIGDAHSAFGWTQQNWVGSTMQHNSMTDDWATFYCEQRLAPLITELANKGIDTILTEADLVSIHQYLSNYKPACSLLHGDLWKGNLGFTPSMPVIFDPAVYIGDREIDLAMAQLFGGFAQRFFSAYNSVYPLMPGAQRRVTLYQLYPVMNHALMFGGSYIQQANQMAIRIRQEIT